MDAPPEAFAIWKTSAPECGCVYIYEGETCPCDPVVKHAKTLHQRRCRLQKRSPAAMGGHNVLIHGCHTHAPLLGESRLNNQPQAAHKRGSLVHRTRNSALCRWTERRTSRETDSAIDFIVRHTCSSHPTHVENVLLSTLLSFLAVLAFVCVF